MSHLKMIAISILFALSPLLAGPQSQPAVQNSPQQKGMMMLTIFLKHDQSKTLDEINQHLKQTGFTEEFPPPDSEVVSWYVMMGIGQVVTLRFPAEKLRDVNLAVEHGAWGAYRTEFYPTYDYMPVWKASKQAVH
jgi:ABC-type tungstate transport system permease subunit